MVGQRALVYLRRPQGHIIYTIEVIEVDLLSKVALQWSAVPGKEH